MDSTMVEVTPTDLMALGYRVVEATNKYVEGGWLAIPPGDPSHVGLCGTDGEAWQWAARHRIQSEGRTGEREGVEIVGCEYCGTQVALMGADYLDLIMQALDKAGAPRKTPDGMIHYSMFDRIAALGEGRTGAGEAQELADYRKLVREQRSRISKLEGALMARPPISPTDGSWWYPEGDTSSDACCSGPSEVLEGAADQMAEGEARIVVIERALELPDVYAVLRVFTDDEKTARDDDEDWDFSLFATSEEAIAALSQSTAGEDGT